LQQLETEIHELAGRPFNVNSPAQLRDILFTEKKLPIQGRTKLTNEPSTDEETLRKLATLGHALPQKIIEHRQINKLKGTYVDALPALVNPRNGRLHTSFNQTVAATGRLSSSDPNLQNIPARTEMGRQIRQAFRPREGWQLVTADYSQIELRLLAHFSGDAALCQAFADDRDIHASVAAEIFHVPEAEVTKSQRGIAKTVNFGVIYGLSPFGLAARLYSSMNLANSHRPIHNLVISNVPGPPFPLYMSGAEMVATYPMGPIMDGAGLNITVMSYRENVDIGYLGCTDLVPDIWDIADATSVAFDEIKQAVAELDPTITKAPAPVTTTRTSTSKRRVRSPTASSGSRSSSKASACRWTTGAST